MPGVARGQDVRLNNSGSSAILAAIRRALSLLSSLIARLGLIFVQGRAVLLTWVVNSCAGAVHGIKGNYPDKRH